MKTKQASKNIEITYNGLICCEETSKPCRNETRGYTVNTSIGSHLTSKSLQIHQQLNNKVSKEISCYLQILCTIYSFLLLHLVYFSLNSEVLASN